MQHSRVDNNHLTMSTFSSQAGAPRAQIRELDGNTHLYGFRYLG